MRKYFLAVFIIIGNFSTEAQLAFTYKAGIPSKNKFGSNWPMISQNSVSNTMGIDYYLTLQKDKIPFLKLSAAYVISKIGAAEVKEYASQNKIDYSKYNLSKSSSSGMLVTIGGRYVFDTKEKAKTAVALELEVGGFFGNGQAIIYNTAAGQTLKTIEGNKTMFVYNPHVDFYGRISKHVTLKIMAGYSNLTGVKTGVGVTVYKGANKVPPPKIKVIPLPQPKPEW